MSAREAVLGVLMATVAAVAATLVPWLRVGPGAALAPHDLGALILSGRLVDIPRWLGLVALAPAASLVPAYLGAIGQSPRLLGSVALAVVLPAALVVVVAASRGGADLQLGGGALAVLALTATYAYRLARLASVRMVHRAVPVRSC